jgi:hypothetical protein
MAGIGPTAGHPLRQGGCARTGSSVLITSVTHPLPPRVALTFTLGGIFNISYKFLEGIKILRGLLSFIRAASFWPHPHAHPWFEEPPPRQARAIRAARIFLLDLLRPFTLAAAAADFARQINCERCCKQPLSRTKP